MQAYLMDTRIKKSKRLHRKNFKHVAEINCHTDTRVGILFDVIDRLAPVIHEIERTKDPILIVGHQGILRIIYAYFMDKPRELAPFEKIPLNTVIKLVPDTYDCKEERHCLIPMSNEDKNAFSLKKSVGFQVLQSPETTRIQ